MLSLLSGGRPLTKSIPFRSVKQPDKPKFEIRFPNSEFRIPN